MKNKMLLMMVVAVMSVCSQGAPEDYVITAGGTYNFSSGDGPYSVLQNNSTDAVTVTQDSQEYKITFSGFQAGAGSSTTFNGIYFDFGLGNFLGDAAEKRAVVLSDAAVITNVSSFSTGGYPSQSVSLTLNGASSLYVTGNAVLGAYGDRIGKNRISVQSGSRLTVRGRLFVGQAQGGSNALLDMDNHFVLTGEDSETAAGSLWIGVNASNAGAESAGAGGSSVTVTDQASLTILESIYLGAGSRAVNDELIISNGGMVSAKDVRLAMHSANVYDGRAANRSVKILDDGTLTVSGDFSMGYTSMSATGTSGNSLIVSNGVFSAATAAFYGKGTACTNCEVRISGSKAKFLIANPGNAFSFYQPGNRFVVENGAKFDWPYLSYSYLTATRDESVIVRGEGTEFSFATLNMGSVDQAKSSVSNRFVLADRACATGLNCVIGGEGGELAVANATLCVTNNAHAEVGNEPVESAYPALAVGLNHKRYGASQNCRVQLSGEAPCIRCSNGASADFRAGTTLVFDLPSDGYDNPAILVDNVLTLSSDSHVVLNGVDKLASSMVSLAEGMTLVRAKTLNIPETVLDVTRSELPYGYKLKIQGERGESQSLVLKRSTGLVILLK